VLVIVKESKNHFRTLRLSVISLGGCVRYTVLKLHSSVCPHLLPVRQFRCVDTRKSGILLGLELLADSRYDYGAMLLSTLKISHASF